VAEERVMRVAAVVGAISLAALAVIHAQAADRQQSLVFSSDRSGAWRIWTVRPDGSGLAQLSRGAAEGEQDVDPAISPDGRRILFTSTRGGAAGVWVMAADGSDARRICDGDQAEWSPDGRTIVLRRGGRIFARDLAAGSEKPVTPADWTGCSGPTFSPDGKTVAFARLQDGSNAIYIVSADGGQPRLVFGQKGACEPHFSPDGARIVYETETHLWTIAPDGTGNRPLTYFGGVQRYGRFSPDGSQVVFCQAPSPQGPWELYVIPSAGGSPRRVTEGGSDMYPDWR